MLINQNLVKSVPERPGLRILQVPATGIAEGLGRVIVANIVMLGFIAAVAGVVSLEAMKSAVLDSIPKGTEELNTKALRAGYEHGLKLAGDAPAGDRATGGILPTGSAPGGTVRADGAQGDDAAQTGKERQGQRR